MIFLVLALNLDLKMSSKLTSICESDFSNSPPSVLYSAGVFDNLMELSEESMASEPPCINCWEKGVPCVESATAKSTRCQFCNLWKRIFSQANHNLPENPRRLWHSIKKGGRFGLKAPVDEPPTSDATSGHSNCELNDKGIAELLIYKFLGQHWRNHSPPGQPHWRTPEVPILVTRKDGTLAKLKRNLVVQDENDTDAEDSDEIDGEELEITTPIQKRRFQSTSLSPVQASTTTNEVIRPPQPGHSHLPPPPPIFKLLWQHF
ncbi:hypothetical protein O181_105497 [Austropuccinia psidii MF-1]|uniref:Uncharacterized protein n=1 Tax=Austropuccinia psidii MF-1 TaxID=1389203 RepID=A0A9Q3JNM3_9BASI|nr:hypothetical protein [Austropuccinia psidii MF-1]